MMNKRASQSNSGGMRQDILPFSIASSVGCLLVLVSFVFLNWNTAFYVASTSTYSFLNGPGVFQKMVDLYGTLAGMWIWITPAAAAVAFVLACAGWFWNAGLVPLVSLPAGGGLVLLMSVALTGDQWSYYKSDGYALAILGLIIVLVSGLWARWSPLLNIRGQDAAPVGLAWCALAGGGLIFFSFFLPWLVLRTPLVLVGPNPNHLVPYQGVPITGLSLASGSLPFLPPAYPRLAPEGYWLLWLVPLAGLLSMSIAWMSLRGRRISRWFWILVSLVPLPLSVFLLRPAVQGSTGGYESVQGNVTTYGWHLTLLGLVLLFFSGLLWKEKEEQEKPSPEQQRKMWIRRSMLGGIAGLVAVAYGGYLFRQTNKMYSTTLTLSLPAGERYGYGAVAWAADGRRFVIANTNAFWIWDTVAMKQIRRVMYPSFVNRDTDFTSIAWSPDQRFIAVMVSGSAQVYEIDSGEWISHWNTSNITEFQQSVAWSADSQRVATTFIGVTAPNNGVEIHDATTGKLVHAFTFPLQGHNSTGQRYSLTECRAVSWSPDNRWLAVAGQMQNGNDTYQVFCTVWDVFSGTQVFRTSYASDIGNAPYGFQLYIAVAWSPDGKRLAIASDTTGVKLWDVSGKKLLRTYIGSGGPFGEGLAWSPDGRYIAAAEGSVVRIWDTVSGQTLLSYRGNQGTITGLAWSPRGNTLVSSSLSSVHVWQSDL